jgi:hypothetical protein
VSSITTPEVKSSPADEDAPSLVKRCTPKEALDQLGRWYQQRTALGMIYARAEFGANLWSKCAIVGLVNDRIVLNGDALHFMIDIAEAAYSVESLQHWTNVAAASGLSQPAMRHPAVMEGLQIWCKNGDWLFLTEQIERSNEFAMMSLTRF